MWPFGVSWVGRVPDMVVGKKLVVAVAASVSVVAPLSSVIAVPIARAMPAAAALTSAEGESAEARAMGRAVASGSPVEVAELTDERTKVVADPETGQFRAELNAFPVRVKREGAWRDIDLSLVRDENGTVQSREGYAAVTLSGGGSEPLVTLSGGGSDTGLAWDGSLPEPVLDGTKATYPEVLPGVDLVAKVGVDGVATFLVVKSREAAANPRVRELKFKAVGSAAQVREVGAGGEIRDAAGVVKFTVQRASMWDSKGARAGAKSHELTSRGPTARAAEVPVDLASDTVAVDVDEVFLSAPETVYPVVIDPEISVAREYTYWVLVKSNGAEYYNSSTEHAQVGHMNWSSPSMTARSFFNFNTSALYGKVIGSAVFSHKLIHSPNGDCTLATFGAGVSLGVTGLVGSSTVWPGPAWTETVGTNAKAHGSSTYCPGYDVVEWNAKAAVIKYAANVSKPTLTLGLKSSNESDGNGWRQFDNDATLNYPLLAVTYNSLPNTPGAPSLVDATGTGKSNFWVDKTGVTLRAAVSDPDGTAGGLVHGYFQIYRPGNIITSQGAGTAVTTGGTSVWSAPVGSLQEGYLYTVRVWGRDAMGAQSTTWSDYIQFRVDVSRPSKPTAATASESYVVGGAAPVHVSWTDTDVAQVCYGRNTDVASTCSAVPAGSTSTVVETAPTGLESVGVHPVVVKTVDAAGKPSDNATTLNLSVTAAGASGIWHLDGDGTDSSGAADLSSTGAPAYEDGYFAEPGGPDRAVSVNGSSQALASAGTAVHTSSSFSVSAWVKWDPTLSSDTYQFAVSQTNATYAGAYLGVWQGRAAFGTRPGDTAGHGFQFAQSPDPLPANQWVHLVGVFNAGSGTNTLFVDGAEASSISGVTSTEATGPFAVGRSKAAGVPAHFWGGVVDEVAVFPRVISSATVRALTYARPAAEEPIQ